SGRDRQCPVGRPAPLVRQGRRGGAGLPPPPPRPPGVGRGKGPHPLPCRPPGRRQAGCPRGPKGRAVKTAASPFPVRNPVLPPPVKTAPDQRVCGRGLILLWAAGCGSGCPYAARCAKYVPKFGGRHS